MPSSPYSTLQAPFQVAFDLDGTLLTEGHGEFPVDPSTKLTRFFLGASLRQGTLGLMQTLQQQGVQLGLYTRSNRSALKLRLFFALSGITLTTIVTHQQHEQGIKEGRIPKTLVKYPPAFGFNLLIDNELVVAQQGERAGFEVVHIASHDRNWTQRVLASCPTKTQLQPAQALI